MAIALIDLAARALLLLALAWMAVVILRRRSASLRALVWTTAHAALLALPVAAVLMPAWRVPVWQVASGEHSTTGAAPVTPAARSAEPVMVATSASAHVVSSTAEPMAAMATAASAQDARAPRRGLDLADVTMLLVALVALALMTRLAASHWQLRAMARRARPVTDADQMLGWVAQARDVCVTLGLRRAVRVRLSDDVSVPAVVGVLTPVVLLPPDATEWSAEVRRVVLLHELAHVARWDALTQIVGQLACAVYWFVPLVWLAARRAASLRERASDDVVLRAGVRPSAYAESLVALARNARGVELPVAALAMARSSRLRERVVAILDPGARRNPLTAAGFVALLLVAGTAVTVVAAVEPTVMPMPRPTVADPQDPPAPPAVPLPPAAAAPADAPEVAPTPRRTSPPSTPVQQPAPGPGRLCSSGLDQSSSSIREDNTRRTWTVKLSGPGCKVDLHAEGKIDFSADFTDVVAISAGGFFRLDVTEQGVRRQLDIEFKNGSLGRTFRLNGRETGYDASERAWFAAFLIELDRRTAIGVDVRLPMLLKQGGTDAVLTETAMMSSDYARSRYYTALATATPLGAADVAKVLRQAAALTKSDHYSAELLSAIGSRSFSDEGARTAAAELIDRMQSDHYRAESVRALLAGGRPGAGEMDLLLRTVTRMKSGHYQADVLRKLVEARTLSDAQQASVAQLAATVAGDHYRAEVLKALAGAGPLASPVRSAIIEATGRMSSAHYAGDVFARLLGVAELTERDLLSIVTAVGLLKSDHYTSEALRRVARHGAATDRVRDAILVVADRLSRHYSEEIRRAIRR